MGKRKNQGKLEEKFSGITNTFNNTDKYRIVECNAVRNNKPLFRIQAIKDFGDVKAGEYGGFIESERNLTQSGTAWIHDNAIACGESCVYEDAQIYNDVIIEGKALVGGRAKLYDNVLITGCTRINDEAKIRGRVIVRYWATVEERAEIMDDVIIQGNAYIGGQARIEGRTKIGGQVNIFGKAQIGEDVIIRDNVRVFDNAIISGEIALGGNMSIYEDAKILGRVTINFDCEICGTALIQEANSVCRISNGFKEDDITAFTDTAGKIIIVKKGYKETIDEYEEEVKSLREEDQRVSDLKIIKLLRVYFDR